MAQADDAEFNEFNKLVAIVAPFLLLLAVGAQLTGLWVDPIAILLTVGGICSAYVTHILDISLRRFRGFFWFAHLLGAITTGVGFTFATISVIETTVEVREACTRYRAVLLQHADSAAADAYEALRCPVYSRGIWRTKTKD